jgi:hypothetical protein
MARRVTALMGKQQMWNRPGKMPVRAETVRTSRSCDALYCRRSLSKRE